MPVPAVPRVAAVALLGGMTALTAACTSTPDGGSDSSASRTAYSPVATATAEAVADLATGTSAADDPAHTGAVDDARLTSAAVDVCRSGNPLVDSATWIQVDGRPSLEVVPTGLLRRCGLRGVQDAAWQELLALYPDADTEGMEEQFTCHVLFAPGKDVWHLEPWRPVVDGNEMMAARCNPGGTDPDLG